MARLLIIVTNKTVYPAFWDRAAAFVDRRSSQPLKSARVGEDSAYLLAEFESGLPQPERLRDIKRQTTAHLVRLAQHELEASLSRGLGAPEMYAAAHHNRVNWQRVKADPRVGLLFKGVAEFSHGEDDRRPLYGTLLRFVSDPTPQTYEAVVRLLARGVEVSAGETDADDVEKPPPSLPPQAAFGRLKHEMVRLLKYVDIDLQGLERAGFTPDYRKAVAEKYADVSPRLLEEFRKNVYDTGAGLASVVAHVRGSASERECEAITAAWAEVQKHLPEQGEVIYTVADAPPRSITTLLTSVGSEAGLEEIKRYGGSKLFNAWYLALDDALNRVRKALDAARGAAPETKDETADGPPPGATKPRPEAGADSDEALPADS